jgi:sugar phosphate isomerase/epimerase
LPVARELDITLALENHYKDGIWKYPEFAQKADVFLELVERIDDRAHFGVQFDPSNAIVAGDDSADFLDLVIDRVVTMQASDRSLAPGGSLDDLRQSDGTIGYSPLLQHGVIGKGLNDYPRIFRTLAAAGYDGWISIEDGVNGMGEMLESVEYLRRARDEYFGGSTQVRVQKHEEARGTAGYPSIAQPALTSPREANR